MKVVSIGGGPAGLYFAILLKQADPSHEVVVYERNRFDDTFGFGVVFSDATLDKLSTADEQTFVEITQSFAHWDDIETHAPTFDRRTGEVGDEVVLSKGHGFSGLSRRRLLSILQRRAAALGVELRFDRELAWPADPDALPRELGDADLVLAADGVNSATRARFADRFLPSIDQRPNRFVWLGTTRPFPAFTFYFDENEHGLFRVHAYQFAKTPDVEGGAISTFIVECTEDTWRRAGLDGATEADTLSYCQRLFERRLGGHRLIANRSLWRSFPTVTNARWSFRHPAGPHVVLVGDAAHTAHFSIGSGTKLAMEDVIALRDALLDARDLGAALEAYERARRPGVDGVQRAAAVSLRWFEETERYARRQDPLTFTFGMLTRSLRIHHANLKVRDPELVARVDRAFAERAAAQAKVPVELSRPPPPMFTPFRLRDLVLENRVVVSPMCMYSAIDGLPNDFHLVHYASRAMGGAGLVMTEMTDISADARITPGCTGLWSDEHARAWKRIVDLVHASSPAKIGVQLAHAGRKGATKRMWEGIDQPLETGAWPLVAPSPIPYLPHSQVPREMTRADMDRVRDDFVRAARFAEQAGFDLLELHMAHGYLLASFLSPLTNHRTDDYGGALHNRLRFPLEVFAAVRDAWPAHKPMSVRISATDWIDGGFDVDEAVDVARALQRVGCDVVDVSSGQTTPESRPVFGRLYQTPFSDRVRNEADVATMTVGNVSSWGDVNAILAAGRADLVVLARGHLYDPYWTRHAAAEQRWPLPWPPQYAAAASFTPRGA
jgi:anthraniloyl-CoA monooxygenase